MIANEVMHSFSSHRLVTVFHYNDVTCQEWKSLRNKLSKYEIKLKVIPAKLSSKVCKSLWIVVLGGGGGGMYNYVKSHCLKK